MKKKRLLMGWLCCLLACVGVAQTPISFTSDQGLSNTCIHSILQDSYKNVWICTQNGLNRYDGAKMNVYYHSDDDAGSLQHNNVLCVLELQPGTVLVGTEAGVQAYSYDTDGFTLLPLLAENGDTLRAHVISMTRLSDGTVYVCTSGYGCYRLHTVDGGGMEMRQTSEFPVKDQLTQLMEDRRHRLWIADWRGRVYCRENGIVRKVAAPPSAYKFCESSTGNIYLVTYQHGLMRYSDADRRFVPADKESHRYVLASATAAPDGELLVSTDGNGLKIYSESTGTMTQSNIRTYEYNLATSNIKDAIVDADGNTWVGVYWKGVLVMPDMVTDFEYVGRRSVLKNTLGTNCVTAITGDGQGRLWVATDHCGIYHLEADGSRSIHFRPGEVKGMPSTVMSILEDSDGTLWLGSSWAGVVRMDKQTGECVPLGQIVPGGERIPSAYSMVEDAYGRIYIGSMGDGLYCYHHRTGRLEHYTTLSDNTMKYPYEILHNSYVRSLLLLKDTLYVGTADGMEVFAVGRDGLNFKRKVLSKCSIYDIKQGTDGSLWVATTGGLAHFSRKGGEVKIYDRSNGLPNNSVSSIEFAADGKVWIGTADGLSVFNPADETFENYTINDGLQGNEFTEKASYALNGILYFGGINGLTYFHPSNVGRNSGSDRIDLRVVDFYVNGQPVHVGDRSGRYAIIDRWLPQAGEVNLSHKDKSFSIELSTMSFGNRRVTYYYSINDGEWIALEDGQNRISFVNMETGTYHLRMKAESYGETSDVKELKVVLHPVWYLSTMAFVIYFILFLLCCYIVVLQVRERFKAKQVLEKHRQKEEMNEARIQFFMNISHEIRTPMTLILSPLKKLMSMDTDEAHQRNYSLIYQNSQRILRLINQLMDARKIEKGQFRLKYHKVELVGFLNNLYELFSSTAANRKIDFSFVHDMAELDVCVDPQNFDKVVMNLLSNAFKFTPEGGRVVMELKDVPGKVQGERDFVLTVTDTGVGIPDKDKVRIFERFYAGNWGGDYVGTGIGLNLTKLLVELHEGDITVENNPSGQGTRFTVRMPQALELMEDINEEAETAPVPAVSAEAEHVADLVEEAVDEKGGGNKLHQLLIVEDDIAIRRYLHGELSDAYFVHECSNGQEAWNYILRNLEKIDLVVSDVMMPVMDGLSLLNKLKKNFNTSHIPVILLTAKTEDSDRLSGLSGGADAYLSKPFNIDILRQTIVNLLQNRQRLQGKYHVTVHHEDVVMDRADMSSPDDNLMEKVIKVVNDELSNSDLNVEQIAEKVGISRVHFHRRLKEITGLTPRDFVRNYRLMQAGKLLEEKRNYDITDISVAVGFKSVSTFSTCFKAYYGMKPSEYLRLKTSHPEEKK